MHAEILKPVVALVAWTLVMWIWLYATRIPAMRRAGLLDAPLIGTVGADLRAKLNGRDQWPADNYNHLLEQPTLFYAICIVIALSGGDHPVNTAFAWAYVALRVTHSIVQATINRVPLRFGLFAAATFFLFGLTLHAAMAVF